MRRQDREAVAQALRAVYRAETRKEAERALKSLRSRWSGQYPKVVEKWEKKAPGPARLPLSSPGAQALPVHHEPA